VTGQTGQRDHLPHSDWSLHGAHSSDDMRSDEMRWDEIRSELPPCKTPTPGSVNSTTPKSGGLDPSVLPLPIKATKF